MYSFLETPEFKADLRRACGWAMAVYGHAQSKYREVEDLQQEVLAKFVPWLPSFRGSEECFPILHKIATNLLIDAGRRDKTRKRAHREVDWDRVDFESYRGPISKDLDPDTKILLEECLQRLTDEERFVFVEYRMNGRSARSIAKEMKVSAPTVLAQFKEALAKMEACLR